MHQQLAYALRQLTRNLYQHHYHRGGSCYAEVGNVEPCFNSIAIQRSSVFSCSQMLTYNNMILKSIKYIINSNFISILITVYKLLIIGNKVLKLCFKFFSKMSRIKQNHIFRAKII